MKKLLIVSICLLSFIQIGCGCNKQERNKTIENNNILKNQMINEIEFSNAKINYNNNISTFTVVVTNKSSENKTIGLVDIVFKNKDNIEIVTLKGLIEKNLKINESTTITASVGIDLRNSTSIEYKFN